MTAASATAIAGTGLVGVAKDNLPVTVEGYTGKAATTAGRVCRGVRTD